jgi:hypothetical protein
LLIRQKRTLAKSARLKHFQAPLLGPWDDGAGVARGWTISAKWNIKTVLAGVRYRLAPALFGKRPLTRSKLGLEPSPTRLLCGAAIALAGHERGLQQ